MIRILGPKGGRSKAGSVWGKSFAAAVLAVGFAFLSVGNAGAETRALKLFHLHTREKAEIVFKRDGRYVPEGLKKINYILRDWRREEPTNMDPRLLDLIWEAYKQSGSHEYINVVCGYRSPETNSMLRSRSKGVAKKSQHMLGKAMDFFIPGVPLKKLREIGLKMQGGGVGYYPTSGSPFVHFDVGNVRHWPKMSRRELIALFPNGKTLHVPSDGKPLPGFDQALAAYQARKKSGDVAIASIGSSKSSSRSGGLLAAFFGGGGGADDEEDSASAEVASADDEGAAPAPQPKAAVKAADGKIRIVSPDQADRVDLPGVTAAQAEPEAPETIVAALPPKDVPLPDFAPRPQVDVGPADVASAETGAGLYATGPQNPDDSAMVALNIPVPTPRPNVPSELAVVEMASAEPVEDAQADLPLPSARPEDQAPNDDQIAALTAAADAQVEPGDDDVDDATTVAALTKTDSAPEALDSAFPLPPQEIIPEARDGGTTVLSYAGTQRSVLLGRKGGSDPTSAVIPAVKTTAKAARPTRKDAVAKSAKQPRVVAAQPIDARWAFDVDAVAASTRTAKAPSFSPKLGTSPKEVYTVGFQQGTQVADANRFTGKAVKFLTVAKFSTN